MYRTAVGGGEFEVTSEEGSAASGDGEGLGEERKGDEDAVDDVTSVMEERSENIRDCMDVSNPEEVDWPEELRQVIHRDKINLVQVIIFGYKTDGVKGDAISDGKYYAASRKNAGHGAYLPFKGRISIFSSPTVDMSISGVRSTCLARCPQGMFQPAILFLESLV